MLGVDTRDAFPGTFVNGQCRPGTVEKVNCWPPPEDPNNENMTIGKLGLTNAEENDLVAFLETPNRRNPSHPDMIFRVRIMRLNSNTTYYYKVESTGATGVSDGVPSSVKR